MSEHLDQGAYFQYADIGTISTADTPDTDTDWRQRTSSEWRTAEGSWMERAMLHARLREELHMEHRGLTDRQVDAIASMTLELRRAHVRLGSVNAMVRAATGTAL